MYIHAFKDMRTADFIESSHNGSELYQFRYSSLGRGTGFCGLIVNHHVSYIGTELDQGCQTE